MLRVILFSFLLSLSLVGSGCTKSASLDYGLSVEETLRINLNQEPPSLDWSKSTDTTSSLIEMNIMDGLVEFNLDDKDLGMSPALAESWTSANNTKTWTFNLRKDVKWTDEVAFEASQIVDGWKRLLDPATASQYAYFLFNVKNAQKFNKGEIKDFSQVGVRAVGRHQLVVELEKPQSYFPSLLAHHSTYPIRLDVIEKHGDRWTEPENVQTLGAYKLKIWDHDKAIVLERNDDYYGEKAKIKNIYGYMINEYSTALTLFESGRLDYQDSIPANEVPNFKGTSVYHESPLLGIYYYGFNSKKPPFDNEKVRKAFVHAVNRDEIATLLGGMTPLYGWVPKGMFGYEDSVGLKYDPEKAKALLKEAGYGDAVKFPRTILGFNSNENHQRVAENYQAQIKKNLGIQVEIQSEEWKVYLNRVQNDTPNIYRLGWLADYPDPDNFLNLMTGYSENNHTGWKNAEFDALIAKGSSLSDKEERKSVYGKAQRLLTEDAAVVSPVYSMVSRSLIADRVQNFPVNSLERRLLKRVSFK